MTMKNLIICVLSVIVAVLPQKTEAKKLVAYFSATGHTQAVAEEIVRLTGADIYRIEPSEPYASNPYDDSDRIQNEAYNNLRPGVANLPESLDDYDVIFVGSPTWWHYPAMVVCTFLESYDLSGKTIVPFFTYAATTYFQQSVNKIHEVTPNSIHLTAFGSTGSVSRVESWLREIGQLGEETGINSISEDEGGLLKISRNGDGVSIDLADGCTAEVYDLQGVLVESLSASGSHALKAPTGAVYLLSVKSRKTGKTINRKITL